MVDSRTQTYWQLIEMLLNNQAQKDEVLNLNQELPKKQRQSTENSGLKDLRL